jgi:hypothetical protein
MSYRPVAQQSNRESVNVCSRLQFLSLVAAHNEMVQDVLSAASLIAVTVMGF